MELRILFKCHLPAFLFLLTAHHTLVTKMRPVSVFCEFSFRCLQGASVSPVFHPIKGGAMLLFIYSFTPLMP